MIVVELHPVTWFTQLMHKVIAVLVEKIEMGERREAELTDELLFWLYRPELADFV